MEFFSLSVDIDIIGTLENFNVSRLMEDFDESLGLKKMK